jgi:hypothetical protein
MKDGFEISLKWVHEFYQWKSNYRSKILMLRKVFEKTQDEALYILGRRIPWKKIFRYNQLRGIDPFELTEEEEKEFKELRENLKVQVCMKLNELMKTVPHPIDDNPFLPNYSGFPDYIDEIFSIRVDPLKMIFNVWHRHLKRTKYSSIKSVKKKLFEYKKKYENTDKEYLFESLNENTNFESLRKKSLYGLKKDFYRLSDFIYKKAFCHRHAEYPQND